MTRAGLPITYPCTPYRGDDGRTLDVSTGLTYPAKAERARRDPRVSLLFADSVGSGIASPPVILVQGLAAVRDRDLQWNTDRYVRLSHARFPDVYGRQPRPLLGLLQYYWARIWIQVTPLRIRWWPASALNQPPQEWRAAPETTAPHSDPPPRGKQPPPWKTPPADWRRGAQQVIHKLPHRDITLVDQDGFPVSFPVAGVELHPDGFLLQFATGVPGPLAGPACLTCHTHPERFASQQNHVFVGDAFSTNAGTLFRVERQLADWSISASPLAAGLQMLVINRRQLRGRLHEEAARRGQMVPRVNFPSTS